MGRQGVAASEPVKAAQPLCRNVSGIFAVTILQRIFWYFPTKAWREKMREKIPVAQKQKIREKSVLQKTDSNFWGRFVEFFFSMSHATAFRLDF